MNVANSYAVKYVCGNPEYNDQKVQKNSIYLKQKTFVTL